MKKDKYIEFVLIFSFLIFVGQLLYLKYTDFFHIFKILSLFIPVIILFLIYIFQPRIQKRKKIYYILIFIIVLIQVSISCLFLGLYYILNNENWYYKTFNNAQDYKIAKNNVSCKKCIAHFPKEIPKKAKNVEFYQHTSYWWGSEEIFLKFEIDEKYIENEIQKYSKSAINQSSPQQIFPFSISDFKFYVLFHKIERFLKEGGIGINDKNNTILYYYNNPDD